MNSQIQFSLQQEFLQLLPEITIDNTNSYLMHNSSLVNINDLERHECSPIKITSLHQKSSLITSFQTSKYLLYAFCLVQNNVMSTLTFTMISKRDNQRKAFKTLKPIYLKITSIKFTLNQYKQILLIAGTACGRLLLYSQFETQQILVKDIKFSPHRILDIIVPSFKNEIFVLTKNAVIYIIDIKEKLVSYQFQCYLPQFEDQGKISFLMDEAEKYICCAFQYGRIIVWDIKQKIKSHHTSRINELREDNTIQMQKKMAKKQGKQKITRNTACKTRANLLSCVKQGIKWIEFLGNFIILLTPNDFIKIMAVNINASNENVQLYLTISQFSLVKPTCKDQENCLVQTVARIQKNNERLLVGINIWKDESKSLFYSCRIDNYTLDEDYKPIKISEIHLSFESPLQEFQLSFCQRYLLCKVKEGSSFLVSLDCQ